LPDQQKKHFFAENLDGTKNEGFFAKKNHHGIIGYTE